MYVLDDVVNFMDCHHNGTSELEKDGGFSVLKVRLNCNTSEFSQ